MEGNEKLLEVLIDEIRELRKEVGVIHKGLFTLKTRFMMVAVTMGLAGGKLSAIFPFLK